MGFPQLDLTNDQLLTTTRAVRKRLDFERPVPRELLIECLEIALQAPTGSNAQGWQFVFVTDADKRKQIGDLYSQAFDVYRTMPFAAHAMHQDGDDALKRTQAGVVDSAEYLAAHLGEVPVFLIPCIAGRVEAIPAPMAVMAQASTYASIIPAAWSFMLAARARGLGTAWTTLHLMHEEKIAELLDIPYAEMTQVGLIPIAYTKGTDFKPAHRKALDDVVHFDRW